MSQRKEQLLDFHRRLFGGEYNTDEHLAAAWDKLYADGCWDFMQRIEEVARYGIVQAYCRAAGAPDKKVLDVGCGDGSLTSWLALDGYAQYLGIDISAVAVESATKRFGNSQTRFESCNFQSQGVDGKFDVIIFNESLFYFSPVAPVLSKAKEALNGGGHLVVSMFNAEYKKDDYRADARKAIWDAVDNAGFQTQDQVRLRQESKGLEYVVRLAKM